MGPYLALPISFLAGLLIVSLFDKTDCFMEKPLTIILCFLSLAAVGLIMDYVRKRRAKGKKESCPPSRISCRTVRLECRSGDSGQYCRTRKGG